MTKNVEDILLAKLKSSRKDEEIHVLLNFWNDKWRVAFQNFSARHSTTPYRKGGVFIELDEFDDVFEAMKDIKEVIDNMKEEVSG